MRDFSDRLTPSSGIQHSVFEPRELARMQHVYNKVCKDPALILDQEDRTLIAKNIIARFRADLTEGELLSEAAMLAEQ
jgi:hypothetical protein